MRIDEPVDLAYVVAKRRRYGFDRDPGETVYEQLPSLEHEQLAELAAGIAGLDPMIIVVGDLARIDRDALAQLGPVTDVTARLSAPSPGGR